MKGLAENSFGHGFLVVLKVFLWKDQRDDLWEHFLFNLPTSGGKHGRGN